MSNQLRGRTGGVLPINAIATKKTTAPQKPSQRSPAPRLRLIIRRLPPGLTEVELWEALGSEWQAGNGKVTWHAFKEGKISKDPSKPSRPGRVYIKVKDQSLLDSLSTHVKATSFRDAKNTNNDPCLVGPPSLEFAPYSKIPSGRNRHDGRQGTIDQDQEFIDFLQSLTEPITKPAANGIENGDSKSDKVTVTPLVQFIKEKKANKAKEKEAAAAAKSSKKNQEGKELKGKESRPTVVVKSNAAAAEKAKIAKATQEAVKAANKSAAQAQSKVAANKTEPKPAKENVAPAAPTVPAAPASPSPTSVLVPKPERQRGNASAASRMIARDLGLAPKEPRTPRVARNVSTAIPTTTEGTPKTETQRKVAPPASAATSKVNTAPATAPAVAPVPASTTAQTPNPPTGPKNNRPGQTPQTKPTQPVAQRQNKSSSQPSAGAKSAFLKHANPSQGVTEELLRTTFSTYGEVTRCEIDKKKGLGYVDFTNTEALKKAMAASPIKVGNGQVVVLENKSPYHKRQNQPGNTVQQQASAGKSNSRAASVTSSAVASAVASPQPAHATVAKTESAALAAVLPPVNTTVEPSTPVPTEPTNTSVSQPATPVTPSTPTAPRGGRSNAATRGGRGGAASTPGRGGFNQNHSRGRGSFRGRGRGNRAGANAGANTGANTNAVAETTSVPSTPTVPEPQSTNEGDTKPTSAEKAAEQDTKSAPAQQATE